VSGLGDPVDWTARSLGAALRRRELSSVAVTEAYLDRIAALNPRLNAFITVTAAHALDRARRADRELAQGVDRGPLHGVPYALKDVIATRGILTTNGSRSSSDWVPPIDATVRERLDAAGGVLLGKLNLWELAMVGSVYGHVRNPWHTDYSAAGSSGGAGAAVGARLVPIAIGTDTGGSIRVPAAHCGIVGLRPTYGRVSRFGVTANAWSVDTVGPLAVTVDDAATALLAIAGPDPRDRTSSRRSRSEMEEAGPDTLEGLRIGLPREHFFDQVHPEVEHAVRAAIEALAQLGARVVSVDLPHADTAAVARTVHLVEAASCHEGRLGTKRSLLGREVRTRLERAAQYSGVDYVKALRVRTMLVEEAARAFEHCDVIVSATDRGLPVRIGDPAPGPELAVGGPNTFFASMTGIPALAVPCGFTAGPPALPISLQLHAGPFQEALLFRVGRAYQRETDWHTRVPPH
jgi:aspartyl-tRNA(Asn)/glutamyl-tRNA(Gln) amidotransferase subunit A